MRSTPRSPTASNSVLELADEFAIPVASSRSPDERAGIVVLEPQPEQLTVLGASLFNHGVTRDGPRRRACGSASTPAPRDETLDMLRAAFTSYAVRVY